VKAILILLATALLLLNMGCSNIEAHDMEKKTWIIPIFHKDF